MSRFHQRLNEDLQNPEFAEAFYDMSVDIALLQVLEEARKALNVSEKELARRMGSRSCGAASRVPSISCDHPSCSRLSHREA